MSPALASLGVLFSPICFNGLRAPFLESACPGLSEGSFRTEFRVSLQSTVKACKSAVRHAKGAFLLWFMIQLMRAVCYDGEAMNPKETRTAPSEHDVESCLC